MRHFLSNNFSVIPRTECKFEWWKILIEVLHILDFTATFLPCVYGEFSSGLFQGCVWKNWNHNPRASATLSTKQATYESYNFTRSTSAWQGT